MTQKYYTIRIRIASKETVNMEIRSPGNEIIGEPSGCFGFKGKGRSRILELHESAGRNELSEADVKELGTLLFHALFDDVLKREFLNLYQQVQTEKNLLRLELDVDEKQFPEVAALAWEFTYLPPGESHKTLWLATAPNIVFSRRRAQWHVPEPIHLKIGERLKIALAAAAPADLGPVKYEEIYKNLIETAGSERIEIFEIVKSATRSSIDALLEKKPHIFHFIGHGRLKDESRRDSGQVALVDSVGNIDWVSADYFSELFNRYKPGLVLLQTCESGTLSASKAFVGIASQVVQMGIPAVAAMQFEVSNATAQRFALEFYRRLSDEKPVDKAVQEARRHIALGSAGYKKRNFATPVLFMCIREGRLFQRQADAGEKELIKDLKAKLTDRYDEIEELYPDVVKFLKEIGKEGIDDPGRKRIELLQRFFDEKISLKKFKDAWQRGIEEDGREEKPDYKTLAALLRRGELIPFLGPGVVRLSGFPDPSSKDMVEKIASQVECDDFEGTLTMISQFCRSEKKYSRGMTADVVRETMKENREAVTANRLYDLIGSIETSLLVISTSYDDLLEQSFLEKGKKFALVYHDARPEAGSGPGKLQVRCSDKEESLGPFNAEQISGLGLFDDGYSIIYKICGCFNLGDIENIYKGQKNVKNIAGSDKASPLLFEEDFFTISKYLEQSIPDHFIRKFGDCGFLFLGYDLDEWQQRLIAYVTLNKWKNRDRSFTIYKRSEPYARYNHTFWKSLLSLKLYGVELGEFVENLYKSMGN